ncbi:hypothetical protein GQ600_18901 [Phytophthora cactorum]|nr:hypothetical protein GQ600_18901 [Phytophthora cactorum]
MNGSRAENLHQGRAISDLPVPEEINAQLVEMDTIPTKFASFYDDHLPGVFWMTVGEEDPEPSTSRWELVEIVFYARWLLVLKLDGWRGHSALCHFDTHAPELEIGERARGDKEWSLIISNGSAGSLTLVSKKRTRIDFWFDQVWKAIENAQVAARRSEREKREQQEMEVKKPTCVMTERSEVNLLGRSESLRLRLECSKPDDKTDVECGEQERSTSTISVEEELAAAPPAKKKSRHLHCGFRRRGHQFPLYRLPAVTTPKIRWLKRKSEDPNDTALVPTQPSSSIPTDASMSESDTTQLPANDAAAEEPKTQEVRIILTGIEPTAAIRKKIDSIAGAKTLKRQRTFSPKEPTETNVKLLCGISRCAHVLDVRWLDESARVGAPVYERAHCLKDSKAEAKWKFDLRKISATTLRRTSVVHHQPQVGTAAGEGSSEDRRVRRWNCCDEGLRRPERRGDHERSGAGHSLVRKTLTQANPQRVYSAELILSSILQQHIDFDQNRLEQSSGSNSRRRR